MCYYRHQGSDTGVGPANRPVVHRPVVSHVSRFQNQMGRPDSTPAKAALFVCGSNRTSPCCPDFTSPAKALSVGRRTARYSVQKRFLQRRCPKIAPVFIVYVRSGSPFPQPHYQTSPCLDVICSAFSVLDIESNEASVAVPTGMYLIPHPIQNQKSYRGFHGVPIGKFFNQGESNPDLPIVYPCRSQLAS